jgi:hypothetical protein
MFRASCPFFQALRSVLGALAAVLLLAPEAARADVIALNFNGLADGSNNAAVQSFMQGVVQSAVPGGTVTVNGALGLADYTGDGHVVGPVTGGTVTPVTLATWNGPGFLVNDGSDRITLSFSFPVYAVSFDFQIFPDGTMPDGTGQSTSDPNWPDFTFLADGKEVFRALGVMPGQDGTFAHSPASGISDLELAPQLLSHSGTWLFPDGVTTLEFVDWPQRIGIDNLQVDTRPPQVCAPTPVPEPASFWLLGCGLVGVFLLVRRRSGASARRSPSHLSQKKGSLVF